MGKKKKKLKIPKIRSKVPKPGEIIGDIKYNRSKVQREFEKAMEELLGSKMHDLSHGVILRLK
ncbi:unnamed protein product [marine sediment metagenome]|uniref:Uncharacterized protein n=1 Tax=marine sediment metagenome TaxID=412755 RepID=X0YI65_9ZZZZ